MNVRCVCFVISMICLLIALESKSQGVSSGDQLSGRSSTSLDLENESDDDLFQIGMNHYQESRYDSAAIFFARIDTPEANLFAGKSYFAISDYPFAQTYLRKVTRDDDPRIFDEARFTLALTDFQTGQYGRSLDFLHNLKSRIAYQNLHREADNLYGQIMGYLSTAQRREAFFQSSSNPVRLDLFRYGLDYMIRSEAVELFETLHPYYKATVDSNILAAISRRIDGIPVNRPDTGNFGKAPEGLVYNIGVLLPATVPGSGEWRVSRSLYNGYHLAAEEFNRQFEDRHIRLHLIETSDTTVTQEAAISRLTWKHRADAIIGPLFSENAYRIRDMAEYYQIPVIPPLANADTLNINNPYLYQINPAFETRGKSMAAFAVNELNLDTLAVITQSNQPVAREAMAFRNEAERLGATVLHYFSDDFEARAFDVSHITPWFAGDERYIDEEEFPLKPVKGLYLSLSGAGASQLIDLILNDLQAFRSNVTILSNEEIAHVELSDARRQYFDIYYSNLFHKDNNRRETYNFQNNYRTLTGSSPDDFAHLGYDVARFLFEAIYELQNPVRIKEYLRHRPLFKGVITNIDLQSTHINQHLHILNIQRDETVLYEFSVKRDSIDDE